MNHRSRAWIQRRLRSLAFLELLNIPLQAALWFGKVGFPITPANAVGFALFALLLLQGAAYWLAKLRRVATAGNSLPGARTFAAIRVLNVPLLIAGVLFTLRAVCVDPGSGSWPGLVFALFAVLEYINYFHTQLMYDTREDLRHLRNHGLRRAHLARDLDSRR